MRKVEIETWALSVIDRIKAGQPIEDLTVELKREWIAPKAAARRLAGHANAARGETILWLVGVDEKDGVTGVDNKEFSSWYASIESQFDEKVAPELIHQLNMQKDDRTFVALAFETDRPPYVVKNPDGGKVSLEVPWRRGTATHSARRSELLRLLSPQQKIPVVEVLEASLMVSREVRVGENKARQTGNLRWSFDAELYMLPKGDGTTVIPFHKCSGRFNPIGDGEPVVFEQIRLKPPGGFSFPNIGPPRLLVTGPDIEGSYTMKATEYEVLISGPGILNLRTHTTTEYEPYMGQFSQLADVIFRLWPARSEQPVVIDQRLKRCSPDRNELARWEL